MYSFESKIGQKARLKNPIYPPFRGMIVTIIAELTPDEKKKMFNPEALNKVVYWTKSEYEGETWHFADNLD